MRRALAACAAAAVLACGGSSPQSDPQTISATPPPESEAPVALNPEVPIAYPRVLFDQRIEGDVVLRLFTDSTGRLIPESTRVAESSNYPALDSAALAGSSRLQFAPAKKRGVAVAAAFLQPVEFRYPGTTGGGTAPPVAQPRPVTQAPPVAPPSPPAVARPDTARPLRADTIRPVRPDTTRPARSDTTRPARTDTTKPPTPPPPPRDTSGTAH
jgi:periplasmic protein TonB